MATGFFEVPIFTGDDLRSWISWLEKFFVREDFTNDDDKLNFAQSFMEGEAISWFQWRQSLWLFNSWEALKKSLWLRFGSDEDPENIKYNTEIAKCLEQLRSSRSWIESEGKRVSKTSNLHPQVTNPLRIDDAESESLGYRSNHLLSESHGGWLKSSGAGLVDTHELPKFDGFMPYSWICQVERFFRAVQYREAAKFELVSMSLEGAGLDWYKEEVTNGEFLDWSNFKKRLLAHFAPAKSSVHSEVMLSKEAVSKNAKEIDVLREEVVQDRSCNHETNCEKETIATSEKPDVMDAPASRLLVCMPPFQKVESRNKEDLQIAVETDSVTSLESQSGPVFLSLLYEVGSGDVVVHNGEVSYMLQVQKEDEFSPQSTCIKSTLAAYKLFETKLRIGHKRQRKVKQRISPKSWQFKYKPEKMTKMSLHVQFQCLEVMNTVRVAGLQKIKKSLLSKHMFGTDCIRVEKNKGTCSVSKDTSDALVRISGKEDAGGNKRLDDRVRKTKNKLTLRCKKCHYIHQLFPLTLSRSGRLLMAKLCYNELVKAKGPKRLFHRGTLRVVTMALLSDGSAACEVVTIEIEYIVWEVYTEVKSLHLQIITRLAFQEYVAGIKNTNVEKNTGMDYIAYTIISKDGAAGDNKLIVWSLLSFRCSNGSGVLELLHTARGEAEHVVLSCITWFFLTVVSTLKGDCLVDLSFLLSLQNELWSEHHLVVQLILIFWDPASVEQNDYFAMWHCWKYRELQAARCGSIQGQCDVTFELKEDATGDVTFHIKHQWGFLQLKPALQRPWLSQKLHNGVILLLQNKVCFRVLTLLGLSSALTTLHRVHNIWHRWRHKDWWFKFKNKAVLYLEAWGQASFQRRGY